MTGLEPPPSQQVIFSNWSGGNGDKTLFVRSMPIRRTRFHTVSRVFEKERARFRSTANSVWPGTVTNCGETLLLSDSKQIAPWNEKWPSHCDQR
jgi:hypothetical protein